MCVPAAFGALGETAVELLHSFVPVSTGDLEQTSVPIVQRPRTWPFQGQNTGSNPVGDATTSWQLDHVQTELDRARSPASNA